MSSNTFTASNGKKVARVPGGILAGEVAVYRDEVKALREFFQHERDEQLGRERVSNSILITPLDPKSVNVLREIHVYNEVTRQYAIWNETSDGQIHRVTLFTSNMLDSAARQWFSDKRPKPWENAQEGEVWIVTPSRALTEGDESVEYPAIFQAGRFRDHGGSWDAKDLTAARRIWPEPSDA